MRPGLRLLLLTLPALLIGLMAALATIVEWPQAFQLKLVFWCWFALVALLALLDAAALRRPRFEVNRDLEPHLALGVQQSVSIQLDNVDVRRQTLWLTDFPPSQLHF